MRIKRGLFILLLLWSTVCRAQLAEIRNIQRSLPGIKDSLRYTDALNRLAMLLYEKNIDSTFYFAQQARDIAERYQYAKGKADALNNLGVVYDLKGNSQLALRYYNEAYNGYIALHDSANIVQTQMNIASVYDIMEKDAKALAHFKSAMAMGNQLKQDSIMAMVIYNFLLIFPNELKKDSVTWYTRKARTIATKYKDNRLLLALDQLSAYDDITNNRRQQGLAKLKATADKALSNHLYFFSLDILITLGDDLSISDSAGAVKYYKQGLATADRNGYLTYSQAIATKLKDFYRSRNDHAAELYYSRLLIKLNDEQDRINNISGIDYIDYAVKEQQFESVRVRSKYQSGFLALAVLICIMSVVIIIILWRNWKNTQKNARILSLQFEQAEATTAALDRLNKNYAQLIKVVAHDLRNPIGAISTMSAMLSEQELDEDAGELVKLIQASADNSLNLIGELLKTDFDEQQELEKKETDIEMFLQQCVALRNFKAKDKKQQVTLSVDKPVNVQLDKEKMSRAVNNLITNAIKFSPEGSTIAVTSRITLDKVLIGVKDEGIGIPIAMQDKVFDPFTSAKRKGTGGEEPFGLGLYITRKIVEGHGGEIRLTSEPGEGALFLIELPLADAGVAA